MANIKKNSGKIAWSLLILVAAALMGWRMLATSTTYYSAPLPLPPNWPQYWDVGPNNAHILRANGFLAFDNDESGQKINNDKLFDNCKDTIQGAR